MDHVLLVEDDKLNTTIFTKILTKIGGYKVTHSEDVERILNLCRNENVALVVMDISLSSSYYEGKLIDGLEITKLLKQDQKTSHIPVLVTTAHAMFGDKEKFLSKSGAEAYYTKPITDHHDFVNTVGNLIKRGKS